MTEPHRKDEIQGEIVHVYGEIEEADNSLPKWWLAIFFLTIVFSIAYWFVFHVYSMADLPMAELEADQRALAARQERAARKNVTDAALDELSRDPATVAQGKQIFTTNCVACHGDRAEGRIGPNLTDGFWIHGGAPTQIYGIVTDGVPAKGMTAWGRPLGPGAVGKVVAYVLSLRNTNVPGKEPQGDAWPPGANP